MSGSITGIPHEAMLEVMDIVSIIIGYILCGCHACIITELAEGTPPLILSLSA